MMRKMLQKAYRNYRIFHIKDRPSIYCVIPKSISFRHYKFIPKDSTFPIQPKYQQTKRGYSTRTDNQKGAQDSTKSKVNYVISLVGVYLSVSMALFWRNRKQQPEHEKYEKLKDPHMKSKDAEAVKHGKYWLPESLVKDKTMLSNIRNFEVRADDVYVLSFPKSGTTWLQEVIYLILNNADTSKAQKDTLEDRFPYLEFVYPGLASLAKRDSPRLIKSHLPFSLLPQQLTQGKAKMVYIARNPKDVSVSYYHFVKLLTVANYQGTFQQFYEAFINGRINYGPWEDHVSDYWKVEQQNLLFITYEEMQQDLASSVKKLATFLGCNLTDQQVAVICDHCSFSAMKHNPSTNYEWWQQAGLTNTGQPGFMRKGQVGDWQNYYTSNMAAQVDELCKENLAPIGLELKDKL